jgi:RHS repeat-associated protein
MVAVSQREERREGGVTGPSYSRTGSLEGLKLLVAVLALLLAVYTPIPVWADEVPEAGGTPEAAAPADAPVAPTPKGDKAAVASEEEAVATPKEQVATTEEPGEGEPGEGEGDGLTAAAIASAAFQTDLFTGAAVAEIPVIVAPGTAGVAPKIFLRYDSSTVDERGTVQQAQWTGLGWNLDIGGMIVWSPRASKPTLIFNGRGHKLVLVDAGQRIYHTEDEMFWRVKRNDGGSWTLWTKDGTVHQFGSTPSSRIDGNADITARFMLDQVRTTSGTTVRYTYHKVVAWDPEGRQYDRSIYPDTITYSYDANGALIGPVRQVTFVPGGRQDLWSIFDDEASLAAIEVRVGGALARRYAFTYDHSIMRRVGEGLLFGDLTLRSVQVYGADGTSTLPPLEFFYEHHYLLTSARNGIGGTFAYTYQAVPLYAPWPEPAPLGRSRVTSRLASDGLGTTESITYSYGEAALSPYQGETEPREFWGHAWVKATDAATDYTQTLFHQTQQLKGRPYKSVTRRGSDGALFRQELNTWTPTVLYPGATFAALTHTDEILYDPADVTSYRRRERAYQYDAYGNETQIEHLGERGVAADDRTETREYAPNAAAYIVGLPTHTVTTDSAGAKVAENWLYYDDRTDHTIPPLKGRLTKRCEWYGQGTGNPCVRKSYDSYGNIIKVWDANGNATTTTYDTNYRTFPATVTTPPTPNAPAGLTTTYTHDPRFGVVLTTTDPNDRTTTNEYDTFGRLIGVTNALNETTTTFYDSFGTVGSQRIMTQLPDGTAWGIWTQVYFDGLGRAFKTRKEAAGGPVVAETTFNTRGLVAKKSLPRFEGTTAYWLTYTHDPLRRLTRTDFPDGTFETTAYSGWTRTFTNRRGKTWTRAQDAYDRLVQVTEPGGGITNYVYDALGRLTTVRDAASPRNVTTIAYDSLGRKTQMTEPNLGTWTYTYDLNGNLLTQTDGKNQTLTFTYDSLNRVQTKIYPGGATITYAYDTGVDGKGRKAVMTDLAGSETYTYDALGRVATVTRTTDGVPYGTTTTYKTFGPPATVTYPDGEVVTYAYDAGGRLRWLHSNQGLTYASGMTYNAAGQLTQITYGDGVVRTQIYEPTTQRLATLDSVKDATVLQSFTYGYDEVGNVTSITDNRPFGNNQTFVYDDLNRLTTATATGLYGVHTYSYNKIGNFLTKTGLAQTLTYTYGATTRTCNRLMPHAVTGTTDGNVTKTYTYDCNGNLTADGERTLTWDADNKPVSITKTGVGTTTFAYSGEGTRVKKVSTTKVVRYAGSYEDHLDLQQYNVKHILAGTQHIATRVVGGPNHGLYFFHGDHLGSLNVMTRAGVEVQRLTYLPFGETYTNAGTADLTFHRFRFTDQEEDLETGLYYYKARYYNPALGRFISPDSVVPEPGDPQSLNRYSYVRNNPLTRIDPTGNEDDNNSLSNETNSTGTDTSQDTTAKAEDNKNQKEEDNLSPALAGVVPDRLRDEPPGGQPVRSLMDDYRGVWAPENLRGYLGTGMTLAVGKIGFTCSFDVTLGKREDGSKARFDLNCGCPVGVGVKSGVQAKVGVMTKAAEEAKNTFNVNLGPVSLTVDENGRVVGAAWTGWGREFSVELGLFSVQVNPSLPSVPSDGGWNAGGGTFGGAGASAPGRGQGPAW